MAVEERIVWAVCRGAGSDGECWEYLTREGHVGHTTFVSVEDRAAWLKRVRPLACWGLLHEYFPRQDWADSINDGNSLGTFRVYQCSRCGKSRLLYPHNVF